MIILILTDVNLCVFQRKEPPVEDPSTQLHSQLTTHETAHSYQHQHERLHQQQRLDSFDQRHQSRNHSLERDHPNPDNFSSDPSFTTEKLWKPTERPTRIHEKVEMEKQNSSQSTRHKTQQMSRRRNTTNHNTSKNLISPNFVHVILFSFLLLKLLICTRK